ncbi:ribonuclease-3 [Mycoplasmopsis mustelae]|uniref:Ribonuclease 3 n=1 Tax=Mycoplasmopsis mustelae TaxID=171289 RepID=A0A4R7UCZ3_9BACT|nr:ribonuclease III [Mycoplasmopsis mustelae]TDV24328.1 ribonuclease-3 [Mycoplasmopsis mustelae]
MNKKDRLLEFLDQENIVPKNLNWYMLATTHKSYNTNDKTKSLNYERLEFLGDSLLNFIASTYSFKKFRENSQGELTRWRASAVQTETLSAVSKRLGLLQMLRTGPGQMHNDVVESLKVQADVFEAMLGAIFVDQGLQVAWNFVQKHLLNDENEMTISEGFSSGKDPKTQLQEYFQSISKNNIHYVLEENNKLFTARAVHEDMVYGVGKGHSKKEAMIEAAKAALDKMQKKGI